VNPHSPAEPRLHIDVIGYAPDGPTQVRLTGELDGEETERLRAGFADLVQRHAPAPIHIDATGLTFLDSAGIRALLTCRRMAERAGSRMSMPRVHPSVLQVLQITGLLTVFDIDGQTGSPSQQPTKPTHAARRSSS
jgi:anti-anti-sigma factor